MPMLDDPVKVLLVDDRPENLVALEATLQGMGLELVSGPEALERAAERDFALAILDVHMPTMTGYEAAERIRRIERSSQLPILFLTASHDEHAEVFRGYEAGGVDYLFKPLDPALLRAKVRVFIELFRKTRALARLNETLEEKIAERTAELERALSELRATQQEAIQRERLRALGTMASGIAHDFNNALGPLLGFSELLLMRPENLDNKAKLRSYLEMIHTGARDAARVVARLREFFRKREDGEVFVPLDLNAVVEEVIGLTQPRWRSEALASGRTIRIEQELGQLPWIRGNASDLREAIVNLVFNAVDAMPEGGTIRVRTGASHDTVLLEFQDTGVGMDDEVRRRCLEPFFSTKGARGTGLGLPMVYGVVERHEGSIEIDSTPGAGTRVAIRLPAGEEAAPAKESSREGARPPARRILVVEDEAAMRVVLQDYLSGDGHAVELASTGDEGLRKVREGAFDLVITDRALPGQSGDQIALAAKDLARGVPVIMLTGFAELLIAESTVPSGVDLLVGKPVTIAALRDAMARVLA